MSVIPPATRSRRPSVAANIGVIKPMTPISIASASQAPPEENGRPPKTGHTQFRPSKDSETKLSALEKRVTNLSAKLQKLDNIQDLIDTKPSIEDLTDMKITMQRIENAFDRM